MQIIIRTQAMLIFLTKLYSVCVQSILVRNIDMAKLFVNQSCQLNNEKNKMIT